MTRAAGPRFGAVVVLFHPSEDDLEHLAQVAASGVHVVAVDNSVQPDQIAHQRVKDAGAELLVNGNRNGLGGALNRGVEALFGQGFDLAFLLDQDSRLRPNFFAEMTRDLADPSISPYIVGPRVWELTTQRYLESAPPRTTRERPAADAIPTSFLITSGSAVSAAAYRKLGGFREDLIIEAIDAEYALRAERSGVGLYVRPEAILDQTRGGTRIHLGVETTHLNASRRYYLIRNAAAVRREYGLTTSAVVRMAAGETARILAFESGKTAKIACLWAGMADGVSGRLGAVEERRRKLSRYASRSR